MYKLFVAALLSLSVVGCSLNPAVLKEPVDVGTGAFISLSQNVKVLMDNFEQLAQANPGFVPEEDQAFIDAMRAQLEGDLKVLGGMIFIIDKWVKDATDLTQLIEGLPQWLEDVKTFQEKLKEAWQKLVDKEKEPEGV